MYLNYPNIDAGYVSFALSDLTGGLPEMVYLKHYKNKMNVLWDMLQEYCRMGYFMGAGTHSHVKGDTAINSKGIVQSHAYALIEVADYD